MSTLIILPTTLFKLSKNEVNNVDQVVLIEHPYYFTRLNFHKQKLVLHRASMKSYKSYIKSRFKNTVKVDYIECNDYKTGLLEKYPNKIIFDPVDIPIKKEFKDHNTELKDKKAFLFSKSDLESFHKGKENHKRILHKDFYSWSLSKLPKLQKYIDKSYDEENRKVYKDDKQIFKIKHNTTKNVKDALAYVQKTFPNNYGNVNTFIYPTTHKEATKWFHNFLNYRLIHYGDYQDSMNEEDPFLFHSVLSSSLNIGLLDIKYVIDNTLKFYSNHKSDIKINNFEGFIRQLIGWREYMKYVYEYHYDDLITSNYLKNKMNLDKSWYDGTTKLLPVNNVIKQTLEYGYMNHIQRLMIVLNAMTLYEISPENIYKWFTEMSIDSYDWVMVSNVYAMGFANDKFMSRPYISSSNYVTKMMGYTSKQKADPVNKMWIKEWNDLYRKFICKKTKQNVKKVAFYSNSAKCK